MYWLDLDYLEVARAALRCSAPFTAMLYVEYWCKAKYGRLALQEVDLLNQVLAHTCVMHLMHTSKPFEDSTSQVPRRPCSQQQGMEAF